MPTRTVLISGASVAGPALAYWLHRAGMRPVVVERAPGIRPGGQTVDLRGAGRAVAQRMGIEDAVRAAGTGELGVRFVDGNDRPRAAFGADAFGGDGPVAELEILRSRLAEILYERTRDDVEYLFDDQIVDVADHGDGVHVTFASGTEREVDLLVAADGLRSRTRDLVFGDAVRTPPLGLYTSYFTIPRAESDTGWARWHNAVGGRTVLIRPDNEGTTRAALSFLSPPRGIERIDAEAQKVVLRATFADVGWEAPRVLAGMDDAPDFYLESIAQVRMSSWSRGRVVLVGDSGYCPSPISGMGTSTALVGAYVLAGELAAHDGHRDAFAAYERVLRPYVDAAQKLPPGSPRLATPRSALGIRALYTALRVVSSPQAAAVAGWLPSRDEEFTLPTYAAVCASP